MTQRDRWKKRPAVERYHAFCDELRVQWQRPLPNEIELIFYLPMPPSWSKKKRREFVVSPHQQKPDIDNLAKAVMDALCKDDARIYKLTASKFWSDRPGIEIVV